MLSREGRQYMEIAPHLALWPGLCLTVVVYSLNMFGDACATSWTPSCAAGSAATAPGGHSDLRINGAACSSRDLDTVGGGSWHD